MYLKFIMTKLNAISVHTFVPLLNLARYHDMLREWNYIYRHSYHHHNIGELAAPFSGSLFSVLEIAMEHEARLALESMLNRFHRE